MAALSTLLTCFLLVAPALAVPQPGPNDHSTHHHRQVTRSNKFKTYHPRSTFETYGAGIDTPLIKRENGELDWKATAMNFVHAKLTYMNNSNCVYTSGFQGKLHTMVYMNQLFNGIPVANAVSNVALVNNKVVSHASNFLLDPASVADATPKLTEAEAISRAETELDAKFNNQTVKLEYFVKDDKHVALTYAVQVEPTDGGSWIEAHVDATSGEIINVVDFVAHASYLAIPFNKQSPDDGFQTITDPEDLTASPNGWHTSQGQTFATTRGNNVLAFKGLTLDQAQLTPQTSDTLNFQYKQDPTLDPIQDPNVDAARTNGFFVGNSVHDLAYHYGFDEQAFNFQIDNFGKGGKGNDPVLLSIQDASGVNNANFASPPDGTPGRCNMFIWTLTTPRRDGALENDIVVHEFTHGITNRMTGGGTGRCLNTLESGGLGEGWSDAVASFTQQSAVTADFAVGKFVTTRKGGIRSAPYSTNKNVNSLMFSDVAKLKDVHSVGEVWATMLHEMYASMVDKHGFSADRSNPNQTQGNIKFFQLLIDALSLQPCNPGFDDARDAILQADMNRFQGENQCLISAAFAKRGLGINAVSGKFINDNTIPSNCGPVAGLTVQNGNTRQKSGAVSSIKGPGGVWMLMAMVAGAVIAAL